MNSLVLATIAGLVTAFLWGVGDWLTPRSKARLSPYQISFTVFLLGMVMYSLLFIGLTPHWPSGEQLQLVSLAAVMISIGYILFVKALTQGAVGVIVPLGSVYPMLTLLLSIIFLSQAYKSLQVIAMVIISGGTFFLSYEKNHKNIPLRELHRSTLLVLAAVVVWGVAFFIINPLVPKLQWQVLLLIEESIGLAFALIVLGFIERRALAASVKASLSDRTILIAGIILGLGAMTLYIGASQAGNITIPAVLGTTSALVTSALGAIYDHEKLGVLKRLGAVAVVAGVILLNI